jgi:hypothetical protein
LPLWVQCRFAPLRRNSTKTDYNSYTSKHDAIFAQHLV